MIPESPGNYSFYKIVIEYYQKGKNPARNIGETMITYSSDLFKGVGVATSFIENLNP